MSAGAALIVMSLQTGVPQAEPKPIQLPQGWTVEGTVDRLSREQQTFRAPLWTGTPGQLQAADQRCRSGYGDGARVKVQEGYASCCPADDTPFGLCDSLTFGQD